MSDILDKIDTSLEEVEEQLLTEFNRLRADNHTGKLKLDVAVLDTLLEATDNLNQDLEHSGSEKRLELRTERHEVLQARLRVVRQLLGSDIHASQLHEAHESIENSRRRLEKRVVARRKKLEEQDEEPSYGSLFKRLFNRQADRREADRNRIAVTEEEEHELQDVDVYLDGGIYSASRELAMLANLLQRGATDDPPPNQPRGKAVFEARELSTTIPPVNKMKPVKEETEGADEDDRKEEKEEKRDIAQTPEEIRRKLQERKYQSSGKASFVSKDIEPSHPQEFYGRKPEEDAGRDDTEDQDEPEEDEPKNGKAVFESRDLTRSPWKDSDK